MNESPRFTLNRSAMQLIYNQPFLDWVNSVDPSQSQDLTLEELSDDNDIFMIPDFDDLIDMEKWIEKRWHVFFDSMLFDWQTDEATWPKNRTYKMFRDWFEIKFHSLVWDMANEPLIVDDWGGNIEVDDDEPNGTIQIHTKPKTRPRGKPRGIAS
jgi:hypothetical protein